MSVINDNFKNFAKYCREYSPEGFDGILLDLGVSSFQLDDKSRGFSYLSPNEKLDMRMDGNSGLTAKKILNEYRPMEGVFMLHLGVDYNPLDYLRSPLIYCYRMYDLSKATENLRNGIYHEGDDGFLIFVPSYHASEFAPLGHHALTLYTVAPDKLKDYSWEEKKEEYAQKLIKLAEAHIPELSKHIKEMKKHNLI